MKWIKASERLPEVEQEYCCKVAFKERQNIWVYDK